MNKTESEFALILEAQKRAGEILRYEPFGMTLRWKVGTRTNGTPIYVKYTPDFVIFGGPTNQRPFMPKQLKFIEVKGPFIQGNRERAVERFRHAKTYYPEFQFEMWQKKDGAWKQII